MFLLTIHHSFIKPVLQFKLQVISQHQNTVVRLSCPHKETAACFPARVLHHRHNFESAQKQVVFIPFSLIFLSLKARTNSVRTLSNICLISFLTFQLKHRDLSLWRKMANFFRKFISNLAVFPAVKAQEEEEEMVDQQDHLRVSNFQFNVGN